MLASSKLGYSIALSLLSGAVNVDTVAAIVNHLVTGENPYTIDGVEAPPSNTSSDRPNLKGCEPTVSQSTTRQFVVIDFDCSGPNGRFRHRASFSTGTAGKVSIRIDPLPTAIGPTPQAIGSEHLPIKRRQLSRMIRAIRRGEDPTLDGIIPLNQTQIETLNALADCRWSSALESPNTEVTWLAVVQCPHHQASRRQMIEMQFDNEGRAVTVRVANASVVRN